MKTPIKIVCLHRGQRLGRTRTDGQLLPPDKGQWRAGFGRATERETVNVAIIQGAVLSVTAY